ncbi:type VI secretion system protein TssA [Bradyrhizobium sp. Pear77]|uniref:type VI secretion system protein TssA n=1 Tax=Bradyrhizobium TaxID=374 RepID=UPI001E3162B2|nr:MULTISPECIES: type VI secretion system protein TssA [Bradyrhizobium]MCC8955326.1 type VI secretion system protein TssA [Bradyrhizobium altum]MCC8965045.1 type VI secretion system protein TssA [Bradyrhizobium oropedii]
MTVQDDIDAGTRHGAARVPGPVPAGTNVRDEAEFEQLETEVRRMDVDGPTAVDWSNVSTLSLHILANRSKDILVACWATYGLFRTGGYQGLAVGLGVLRGMVAAHWEGLFPPIERERARVGAIDWLAGRIAPELAANVPIETDDPAVLAAYEELTDLDRQLRDKLVNEQASLGELLRALRPHYEEAKRAIAVPTERAAEAAPAVEQAGVAPAESTSPVEVAQPAAPEAARSAGADGDWASLIDHLPDMLRLAAAARRVASPTDPKVYLLNRVGSWMRFDALPPDTGGRTAIFAPADDIAALEAKIAAGQHADVLNLAEEIVWMSPFWLDVHRHAAKALEQMGPLFEPAAAAVRASVALLVTRYPRILTFQFNDGRAFADEETRAWAAVGGADVSPGRDPADEAIVEAHKLIDDGRPQAALEKLSRALDGARGERARFVRQLAQARFCIETGFVTTAIPLLEHMEEVVAERNLESWEPELALDVAELRFRAITHSDSRQMLDEPRRRAALEQIRTRVAVIDIARASTLVR